MKMTTNSCELNVHVNCFIFGMGMCSGKLVTFLWDFLLPKQVNKMDNFAALSIMELLFNLLNKYWALAVPAYLMVTVVLAIGFYIGLNFRAFPPPNSFSTMFDEFGREPLSIVSSRDDDEQPIEPISDIGIDKINDVRLGNFN